jgi:carbonic anhydrase
MPHRLRPFARPDDILPRYQGTPIERLLRWHNLGDPLPHSGRPELVVGMCMDYRKGLLIPTEFAFVLRAAGANMHDHEFDIAYAVAVGGVTTMALLTHTDCAMSNVGSRRAEFVAGMVERAGWERRAAETLFDTQVEANAIGDPTDFAVREAARLRRTFPQVHVAPLLYRVEDDRIDQIVEP